MKYVYIGLAILLVVSILLIIFLSKNNKLKNVLYKLSMCEDEFNTALKNKEDLVLRLISIINRQLNLDLKEFTAVKNIKVDKLTLIEKDNALTSAYDEILKIHIDHSELSEVKSFDGIMEDVDKNEIELISLRTLYNKNATIFNSYRNKFCYKIICKFKKENIRELFEGKELHEVIEKELDNLVI